MRVAPVVLVAALSCGALVVLSPTAGAAAPAASKACSTLATLQEELDDVDPSDQESFDSDTFQDVGDAFHKAAKKAPKDVKSALKTLGDVYEAMGDGDGPVEALQEYAENSQKFTKAVTKFSNYYSTACG